MSRTRSITRYSPNSFGGTCGSLGTPRASVLEYSSTITDIPGPGDGSPFSLRRITRSGGRLYTDSQCANSNAKFFRGEWSDYAGYQPLDHPSLSGQPSNTSAATQAVAKTNPNRADISVPNFIFELKDLPGLVKSSGDDLLRKAAGANLKFQFGIKPLASDLAKMLTFLDYTERRIRELNSLATSKGLRRTVQIGNYSWRHIYTNVGVNSSSVGFPTTTVTATTTQRLWCHVRYAPAEQLKLLTSSELRILAWRAVYGLNSNAINAWNAIPWSWLVDWFSTTGSLIASRSNFLGIELPDACQVMRHTVTRYTTPTVISTYSDPSGYVGGIARHRITPMNLIVESKVREPGYVGLEANLPILTDRQTGILASIGVLRRR